jgi:hypothetical protein
MRRAVLKVPNAAHQAPVELVARPGPVLPGEPVHPAVTPAITRLSEAHKLRLAAFPGPAAMRCDAASCPPALHGGAAHGARTSSHLPAPSKKQRSSGYATLTRPDRGKPTMAPGAAPGPKVARPPANSPRDQVRNSLDGPHPTLRMGGCSRADIPVSGGIWEIAFRRANEVGSILSVRPFRAAAE